MQSVVTRRCILSLPNITASFKGILKAFIPQIFKALNCIASSAISNSANSAVSCFSYLKSLPRPAEIIYSGLLNLEIPAEEAKFDVFAINISKHWATI